MPDLYDRARLSKAPDAVRARVERLEYVLERLFTVPGINRPVGLDAILSLVPGVGTISGAALGTYLVWEARNLGLSKWQMARMNLNTLFDMAVGAIPVIGIVPDFFFRSNSRNLRIIRKHLDKHHPAQPDFD
ncbi:DUF4112 domain-containing protein [Sphingomicrobium aestuariivivum]|uniref:DUF4112 domain-containing protein n=1 Tax=Sphingomicrobium aestuariivivum TaxID=1582356 RepID=UPI001FD6DDCA|nr:DUF4112 domain-containing protein [Sphingomicrobium aestuariivivum]MCJ8190447.1 DUF4112 domain-containing protein [Sphingomicrobium aestuariivivum]